MLSGMTPTKTKAAKTTNTNTVSINVELPASLHKRLRVKCVAEGLQLKEAIAEAVTVWLRS
jgi:hypothetical protein